jgi:hypothetical protein
MHRTLRPLAVFAVLGFFGSAIAQDAVQTGADAGGDEMMTCADLNEMEPEEGISFLRGYQYGLTAESRTAASGAGNATTTGDPRRSGQAAEGAAGAGAAAEGTPFDFEAILASCFDVPDTPLDEALSGAFGVVN